jgi:hypothetical protein
MAVVVLNAALSAASETAYLLYRRNTGDRDTHIKDLRTRAIILLPITSVCQQRRSPGEPFSRSCHETVAGTGFSKAKF